MDIKESINNIENKSKLNEYSVYDYLYGNLDDIKLSISLNIKK